MLKLSSEQKKSLELAVSHYGKNIHLAEQYLASRGLDLAVAGTYHLGVVQDPLAGHEQYVGRLAIPYVTKTGVIDIRFRDMTGNSEVKYLGLPGAETHLYNVTSIFHSSSIIGICEGEIDTITLEQCGIPAIGVPGANNWKKHYGRVLRDFSRIIVFADGDQAGQDFGRHISKELGYVTIINMPDGEDVNSVYCTQGPEVIREKAGLNVK